MFQVQVMHLVGVDSQMTRTVEGLRQNDRTARMAAAFLKKASWEREAVVQEVEVYLNWKQMEYVIYVAQ